MLNKVKTKQQQKKKKKEETNRYNSDFDRDFFIFLVDVRIMFYFI